MENKTPKNPIPVLPMNSRVKDLWIEALRSGKYKQTQGALKLINESNEASHCCLGVLCELHIAETGSQWDVGSYHSNIPSYHTMNAFLPSKVIEWAGISGAFGNLPKQVLLPSGKPVSCLAGLNDGGMTFAKIADVIEEML